MHLVSMSGITFLIRQVLSTHNLLILTIRPTFGGAIRCSTYEELIQPCQQESVSWEMEHWSVRIGYGRDHGLFFASGRNSNARHILMPSKVYSLDTFPKASIFPRVSICPVA